MTTTRPNLFWITGKNHGKETLITGGGEVVAIPGLGRSGHLHEEVLERLRTRLRHPDDCSGETEEGQQRKGFEGLSLL